MDDITVIEEVNKPHEDSVWTSIFGQTLHPFLTHPVFLRHNGSPINLIDLYHGQTCYIIARGPSIKNVLENKEVHDLLMHPAVIRYAMNSSPEIIDYNCQLWSAADRITKFPSRIMKNPSIMKLIPLNRFYQRGFSISKGKERNETIAYGNKQVALCPNTIGVHNFLLDDKTKNKISFSQSFLSTPSVLYGYYRGFKSILLFVLKVAMLLGFKRLVLLGVDFKMNSKEPYYKQTMDGLTKFHVDHNNNLFVFLAPLIKEIYSLLQNKKYGYNVEIVTANKIEAMPFIPTVNLKDLLKNEIAQKINN